jgi:hypothetical protein
VWDGVDCDPVGSPEHYRRRDLERGERDPTLPQIAAPIGEMNIRHVPQ